jgi:hypothetical protein
MMRAGVPVYRLPAEVVQREIDRIVAQGIELVLNHRVDDVEALLHEYDAVFVAIGAHGGVKLPIPGKDLPDVWLATDFLRESNLAASHDLHPGEGALLGSKVRVAACCPGRWQCSHRCSHECSAPGSLLGGHDLPGRARANACPRLGSARRRGRRH